MKFKAAVVQFDTIQHQPEENLKKMEKFIESAKEQKAEVIIFPEDFITGPILSRPDLVDDKYYYREIFSSLAKKYAIDIVPGSIIEKDKKGIFNVSYYIDHKGIVLARYCKINLWLPERPYISAGNEATVFNTRFGKAGIVICWDLIFPEIFRKMVKRGVELVYCPSWWSVEDAKIARKHDENAEKNAVNALCSARAHENGIAMVYCNAAGRCDIGSYHDTLIGQSQVSVPFHGTINILKNNSEAMFVQEIDTTELKDHERAYKIREDLRKRTLC